jgi:hypothetical protein
MTHRILAALVMQSALIDVASAQVPRGPANWVDTIVVGRLPTGSCHWSTASARLRPGKPGTTTWPGPPNEKTCTVLFSNYTTGRATDPPGIVAFAYIEDHKVPVPRGASLNFADTFTVARKPDGTCDWSKTPFRQGKPGTSSYVGEIRVTRCWGVVNNVTYARSVENPLQSDTTVVRGLSDEELVADMKATYALLKKHGVSEADVVRTSRGKTDAMMVVRLRKGEARYTLAKKDGVWSITRVDTTVVR